MPIDLAREWHNHLDHINKHHNGHAISTAERHHLMAFRETVVLVELMLNAPEDHVDARTRYLTTTNELAHRLGHAYTTSEPRTPSTATSAKAMLFETTHTR